MKLKFRKNKNKHISPNHLASTQRTKRSALRRNRRKLETVRGLPQNRSSLKHRFTTASRFDRYKVNYLHISSDKYLIESHLRELQGSHPFDHHNIKGK